MIGSTPHTLFMRGASRRYIRYYDSYQSLLLLLLIGLRWGDSFLVYLAVFEFVAFDALELFHPVLEGDVLGASFYWLDLG